jgi:hypothetical protein
MEVVPFSFTWDLPLVLSDPYGQSGWLKDRSTDADVPDPQVDPLPVAGDIRHTRTLYAGAQPAGGSGGALELHDPVGAINLSPVERELLTPPEGGFGDLVIARTDENGTTVICVLTMEHALTVYEPTDNGRVEPPT